MTPQKQFINGQWVTAQSGQTRNIINPFNQNIIATVAEGNRDDARTAIAGARQAFDDGRWSDVSAVERGRIVRQIAYFIERDRDELARLETLDTGKTVTESYEDMDGIAEVFHYYADLAGQPKGTVIDSPIPDTTSKTVREPVGVCGQITPWNYPLLQASWKLAPALVAGNTLVMKPSEITPLTTIKVFELIAEAGVPAGVAQLVLGAGHDVGDELTTHTDVDLISFTGGIETGKKIMSGASVNVKNVALELGGKNPNIIFADTDLETAVDQAMNGVFFHAGQICSASTRLIVEESIHDSFVEALVQRVRHIQLGDGFADETEMGPLISREHLDKVTQYVETGKTEGAKLEIGGSQPDDEALQDGFFYLPTVFTQCTTDMHIVQQEGFGPVITIETFSDESEAVALANDSIYGLSGGVWTADIAKAERCAANMRMGTVWINDVNVFFAQAPWGGYKQSGIGHELGDEGLAEYTNVKHIYHNTHPQPVHWFGKQ